MKFIPREFHSHFSVLFLPFNRQFCIVACFQSFSFLFCWFSKWAETDFFGFFYLLKSSFEKNCARHKNMFKLCLSIKELYQIFGQLFIQCFKFEMPSLLVYKKNCSELFSWAEAREIAVFLLLVFFGISYFFL